MSVLQTFIPKSFFHFPVPTNPNLIPSSHSRNPNPSVSFPITPSLRNPCRHSKPSLHLAASATPDSSQNPNADPNPNPNPNPKTPRPRGRRLTSKAPPEATAAGTPDGVFPATIPRKPRRGRRSESAAVEDFVRDSIERTFSSIRQQNSGVLEGKEEVLKQRAEEGLVDEEDGSGGGGGSTEEVVEEDDPDWPADAEVGWGVRASEYFEKYPIKNVVVDGVEIDWEREMEEELVKEINCLEWESFAFHPSPLMVLVFERYNRAADNWKFLRELEKAAMVYWNAKDKLPPRTVKIDINIERDLAYALKVRECPQLLFLKGNRILYREKEIRTSDELVHMIAHFYYNAKRPSWVDAVAVAPPI